MNRKPFDSYTEFSTAEIAVAFALFTLVVAVGSLGLGYIIWKAYEWLS